HNWPRLILLAMGFSAFPVPHISGVTVPTAASARGLSQAPVITQIGTTTVKAGVAFTVGVWGLGFSDSSVILVNGVAMPTTLLNSNVLQANVSATVLP